MASNYREWTTENSSGMFEGIIHPCVVRGGHYGSGYTTSNRGGLGTAAAFPEYFCINTIAVSQL